jgi:hypothetical protein
MKRRDLIRSILFAPLASRWFGATALTVATVESNAVASYREAASLLPALAEAEATFLSNSSTARLGRTAAVLVRRSRRALDAVARGASAPVVDWGDAWTGDGFERVTAWMMQTRTLARLATLRARLAFHAGLERRAMGDVFATLAMARHLASGGVFIAQIVGWAIEHATIDAIGAWLPRLGRSGLADLRGRLDSLPIPSSLADAVRAERAFFLGYSLPRNRDEIDHERAARLLSLYDRLAEAAAEPGEDFVAIRCDNPVELIHGKFVGAFEAFRLARVFVEVKRALLFAGIEVAADGLGAINRVPDPSDGLPFDLKSWATGFELTSRFALEGKPKARLVVGTQ